MLLLLLLFYWKLIFIFWCFVLVHNHTKKNHSFVQKKKTNSFFILKITFQMDQKAVIEQLKAENKQLKEKYEELATKYQHLKESSQQQVYSCYSA